jgi:3-methyl-2-oxobutanoate hydroxymethyltransferase
MADAIEGYVGAVERGEFSTDEHSHYEAGIDEIY